MSDNPEVFIDPKMSAAAEEIKSEVVSPGSDPKWLQVWFMNPMRIAWDWNDLFEDATTAGENLNLTIAGLVLSNNVEFAAREGEAVLRQLGFDGIRSEHYLLSTETKNKISKPARTFGHKKIERQGKEYHVFCAVFKGTTTLPDTITDIKSILDGFYMGGLSCAESLKEYMDSFEGAEKDNSILFITGHSSGSAADLSMTMRCLSILLLLRTMRQKASGTTGNLIRISIISPMRMMSSRGFRTGSLRTIFQRSGWNTGSSTVRWRRNREKNSTGRTGISDI